LSNAAVVSAGLNTQLSNFKLPELLFTTGLTSTVKDTTFTKTVKTTVVNNNSGSLKFDNCVFKPADTTAAFDNDSSKVSLSGSASTIVLSGSDIRKEDNDHEITYSTSPNVYLLGGASGNPKTYTLGNRTKYLLDNSNSNVFLYANAAANSHYSFTQQADQTLTATNTVEKTTEN
jgi:hypothetical protein